MTGWFLLQPRFHSLELRRLWRTKLKVPFPWRVSFFFFFAFWIQKKCWRPVDMFLDKRPSFNIQDTKSPLPWVSDKGLAHGAFARWATDTGKCLMVTQSSKTISKQDCVPCFQLCKVNKSVFIKSFVIFSNSLLILRLEGSSCDRELYWFWYARSITWGYLLYWIRDLDAISHDF